MYTKKMSSREVSTKNKDVNPNLIVSGSALFFTTMYLYGDKLAKFIITSCKTTLSVALVFLILLLIHEFINDKHLKQKKYKGNKFN